jgi:hypothetical protein
MFDNLNIEVLGIKIKFGKEDIMIISYYNPPDKMLSKELFTVIQDLKINYILLGDLNSKLTSIGCNKDNRNGIFLEEILNNNNCVIVNDKTHTYYPFHENYSCDILDLALCSSFLYKYIKEFVVLRESDMSSDHVPIMIILKTDNSFTSDDTRHQNTFYNYNKADWKKFKANLPSEIPEEIKSNVELLNNFVINQLQASAKISIPLKNPNKKSGLQLPAYILELIKYRKIFRKKFQTEKTTDNRQKYNSLTKLIREEINCLKNNDWKQFILRQGTNPLNTKPFWQKINSIRHNKSNNSIPTIIKDNVKYETDQDKANLFSSILKDTFSDQNDIKFDNNFRDNIEQKVKFIF